ncbi:MAG TPA: circadian clock KaiB family protein [Myxococcales bacterium]|nr:circadian clock KaiB family protein [Myxococcales bacterium]
MSPARRLPSRPEGGTRKRGQAGWVLRLYVAGLTPTSTRAVAQVRAICDEHLAGRYELEVIDIYQLPALAKGHQIVATPTLIRLLPAPLRRYIGNLSNEQLVFGLDLRRRGT